MVDIQENEKQAQIDTKLKILVELRGTTIWPLSRATSKEQSLTLEQKIQELGVQIENLSREIKP